MEFYFKVENINKDDLVRVFEKHYPSSKSDDGVQKHAFVEDMERLKYQMAEGFMNGSIDLVFEKNEKFYVVDWKSNHLGTKASRYNASVLLSEVRHAYYFLQYHIYTLALHRYLKNKLKDYDYDQHMGGVFYAFVRGFKVGTSYGIHRDTLSKALIEDMEKLIIEGESISRLVGGES